MEREIIQSLQETLSLQVNNSLDEKELRYMITERINELIQHDFAQLIQLLYQVDINEAYLKKLLNEAGEKDAAEIIAELIIERQVQKLESRKRFKINDDEINEEEKW
ncbi:MAG: hypothetical protein QM763_22070 [Agriterribacter sp.]